MAISQRFARLTYPIHGLGASILTTFPILKKISGFNEIKDERVIAYVIYLYDKGSDLPVEFKDLSIRKESAATEAGFDRNEDGEWPGLVARLFDLGDPATRHLIINYLHFHNHRDITMIH